VFTDLKDKSFPEIVQADGKFPMPQDTSAPGGSEMSQFSVKTKSMVPSVESNAEHLQRHGKRI